ncbi:NADH dehydrogenase [ubiquinone] 1 beta subcomplex subunit 10 [Salminus brasiliensis]|uniref:NADH dehydrogenase [ubiquinone] 1 beta subcomplex subunit 10 n=1 Tax=Salminus brasiliensis TaxID=930266 RepID=UPI003B83148F
MPEDYDKDVYPEPPRRTPVVESKTSIPNPLNVVTTLFHYTVDLPVTTFKYLLDSLQRKEKYYYYHQRFRRVPELTECKEGDYTCYFEAEMQWRRDYKVDQEIVKIIQRRVGVCQQREGNSAKQNCAKEVEQFREVSRQYQSRYGDLGAYANARKCLMKQKERMMAEQQQEA